MPAILTANTNTKGSGLTKGTSADSGNITANGKSGVGARRLTYGGQQQATNAMQCDQVQHENAVHGAQPTQGVLSATITNISVATTNGVSTATVTAANTFLAGMTVIFKGLTLATALNYNCGVVTSTGLSAAGFQCTLTGFTAGTVNSGAEVGTASVAYGARTALLSVTADTK